MYDKRMSEEIYFLGTLKIEKSKNENFKKIKK